MSVQNDNKTSNNQNNPWSARRVLIVIVTFVICFIVLFLAEEFDINFTPLSVVLCIIAGFYLVRALIETFVQSKTAEVRITKTTTNLMLGMSNEEPTPERMFLNKHSKVDHLRVVNVTDEYIELKASSRWLVNNKTADTTFIVRKGESVNLTALDIKDASIDIEIEVLDISYM